MSAWWWASHVLMIIGALVVMWLILYALYALWFNTVGRWLRNKEWANSQKVKLHEAMAWDDGFKSGANWQWHRNVENHPKGMDVVDKPENPFYYVGIHDDMIGRGYVE